MTCLLLGCVQGVACAQSVQGYVELRLALPSTQQDWSDGGLGKTRFGGNSRAAVGGALMASWQVTPVVLASATLQLQSDQQRPFDVLDASVRWRPVSTTPWRWSVKVGSFFPPISLENDDVGWTSPWTLTPSAINSWVGEELRSTGVEVQLEHRGDAASWRAVASVFAVNDPAGELLATRGWALGDTSSGLFARVRQPDVYASRAGTTPPVRFDPFLEIDHRIGWYAGITREGSDGSRVGVLHYDNRGDPEAWTWNAGRRLYAWRTRFWSAGGRWLIGDSELLSQFMVGSTAFEPVPGLYLDSRFKSAYLMLGRNSAGSWQPALRLDWFAIRRLPASTAALQDEHGTALTLALNWRPSPHWRFTGELLRVDSTRNQRRLEGASPRQIDLQAQLGLRWYF